MNNFGAGWGIRPGPAVCYKENMMGSCCDCGSSIPDGQEVCSMCYGDVDYGNDGYYQAYMDRAAEERQREEQEWAVQEQRAQEEQMNQDEQ